MTMDRETLESLERLLAAGKATPLPWRSEPPNDDTPHIWILAEGNSGVCKIETCDYDDGKGERHTEEDLYNGDLILTAVNNLPALLSHIRELEGDRNEADRATGEAQRRLESLKRSEMTRGTWLNQRKLDLGFDLDVSFDVVWERLVRFAGLEGKTPEEARAALKDHRQTHLTHCNQGDYLGSCKYGEDQTCPALDESRSEARTEAEGNEA